MIFGLQKHGFSRQDFEQTDTGQVSLENPPLTQEKRSPWRSACAAPPLQQTLCVRHGKKWSTSSLFQPPHWSGRRFWGRPRGTFGLISRSEGPPSGLWPGGYPPFGLVFGINKQQSSARKAPPFGRGDARVRRNKVVLGQHWSSATRRFFRRAKRAVLARPWAK